MDTYHLKELRNRHEVIRYFDGYMSERFDDLTEKKLRRPLIKTQLLELRDGPEEIPFSTNLLLTELLWRHNVWTKQLDETMFLLHDEAEGEIGFLEVLRPRILAVYSPLDFIKICFDFRTAFCVSAKFGSYAARNMFP